MFQTTEVVTCWHSHFATSRLDISRIAKIQRRLRVHVIDHWFHSAFSARAPAELSKNIYVIIRTLPIILIGKRTYTFGPPKSSCRTQLGWVNVALSFVFIVLFSICLLIVFSERFARPFPFPFPFRCLLLGGSCDAVACTCSLEDDDVDLDEEVDLELLELSFRLGGTSFGRGSGRGRNSKWKETSSSESSVMACKRNSVGRDIYQTITWEVDDTRTRELNMHRWDNNNMTKFTSEPTKAKMSWSNANSMRHVARSLQTTTTINRCFTKVHLQQEH